MIQGLYYHSNIVTNGSQLIEYLDNQFWENVSRSSNSREIQHYGFKYNYNTSYIYERTTEIPECFNPLIDILMEKCAEHGLDTKRFNQCIVNNYEPGQGISKHIDNKKYGPVIGCFTLNSGCNMIFETENELVKQYVEPNSLYIMSGEARYNWKHSMDANKFDNVNGKKIKRDRRISITFRTVL